MIAAPTFTGTKGADWFRLRSRVSKGSEPGLAGSRQNCRTRRCRICEARLRPRGVSRESGDHPSQTPVARMCARDLTPIRVPCKDPDRIWSTTPVRGGDLTETCTRTMLVEDFEATPEHGGSIPPSSTKTREGANGVRHGDL